jgi:hypothetical protein
MLLRYKGTPEPAELFGLTFVPAKMAAIIATPVDKNFLLILIFFTVSFSS